jgi:thioredoxin reductase
MKTNMFDLLIVGGGPAAGDIRLGSTKRVAAAVGEGATALQMVHQYLSE